jgi:Ca-activated chloride channel family protein
VTLRFAPGTPATEIASSSHHLTTEGATALTGEVAADKDVVLTWQLPEKASPSGTLFVEDREDGGRYGLLLLSPPAGDGEKGLPTRTLFVVDISGSMEGPPLAQAKEALLRALGRLRPYDELALIRFDDSSEALWETFHSAASGELDTARRWVDGLAARGGTDIEGALRHAMRLAAADPSPTPTRIVLLTDGAVDDEDEVVAEIARSLGEARLHVLGIGAAPNRALVRKVAQFGRGTCAFVDRVERVAEETDAFLDRLERPALTDLTVDWSGTPPLDLRPFPVPDLYVGQTLALSLRLSPGTFPGAPTLRGRRGLEDVVVRLPEPVAAQAGSGVATRWARRAVEGALDRLADGADPAEVRQEVVALGTGFSIVTPYTSFVAVDVTPRAAGTTATPVSLVQALPAGMLPQGGTDGPLHLLVAALLAVAGASILLLGRGLR